MPVLPNVLERFLARRGVIPPLLLDVGVAMFQFGSVLTALEVGLFGALQDGPADAATLARRTGCSERGLRNLLQVLDPLGYVEKSGDTFRLTKTARRTLPLQELETMAPFFRSQAETFVRDGARGVREAPEDGVFGWEGVQSGEVGRGYQAAMRWLGSQTVPEVVKKVKLSPPPRAMLDVGGAHGLYTVAFCRKYPEMKGTVLDWEIGLESARRTLEGEREVADRIDLLERDFEREELPDGYDFAFLGNIVHGLSPDGNRELFAKLGRATTDRGTVALVDQLAGVSGSHFARSMAALLGFNLFLFSGGRSYEYDQLRSWLEAAGFGRCERKKLRQPGFSLVIARKR